GEGWGGTARWRGGPVPCPPGSAARGGGASPHRRRRRPVRGAGGSLPVVGRRRLRSERAPADRALEDVARSGRRGLTARRRRRRRTPRRRRAPATRRSRSRGHRIDHGRPLRRCLHLVLLVVLVGSGVLPHRLGMLGVVLHRPVDRLHAIPQAGLLAHGAEPVVSRMGGCAEQQRRQEQDERHHIRASSASGWRPARRGGSFLDTGRVIVTVGRPGFRIARRSAGWKPSGHAAAKSVGSSTSRSPSKRPGICALAGTDLEPAGGYSCLGPFLLPTLQSWLLFTIR